MDNNDESAVTPLQKSNSGGIPVWLYRLACIFMLLAIIGIPLFNITCSADVIDTFFSVNMYRFFGSAPDCICLPLFMTAYLGHLLTLLADFCSIPQLLALRLAVAFCFYGVCILFFSCFRRRLGTLTLLTGMAVGACFSKACLYLFYYTQVSQLAICLMAILILKAIEKESSRLLAVSAFVSVFTIFLRISNIVFLCLYLLLFMRSNLRSVNWKKEATALCFGAATALILVSIIIHQTIGWERAIQLPDVIRYAAADGHTAPHLLCLLIRGIISKSGLYLCYLAVPLFIPLYFLFLPIASARLRKILVGIVCTAAFFLLCIHIRLFDFILSPNPEEYPSNGFILGNAIQFVIWVNVCLLAAAAAKKATSSDTRLLTASLMVALAGPFGSNTEQMPAIYSAFFCLPIVFYGLKLCWRGDLFRQRPLFQNLLFVSARKAGTASAALIFTVISLYSLLLSTTYVFFTDFTSREKIHLPFPILRSSTLLPAPDNSIIANLWLSPRQKEHFDACLTECKPHIKPGTPLISMPYPAANALLDAPPALKWRGGDAAYSPPESIREQLHCAKVLPSFVLQLHELGQLPAFTKKVQVAESFAQEKGYKTIMTPHFKILLPPNKNLQSE